MEIGAIKSFTDDVLNDDYKTNILDLASEVEKLTELRDALTRKINKNKILEAKSLSEVKQIEAEVKSTKKKCRTAESAHNQIQRYLKYTNLDNLEKKYKESKEDVYKINTLLLETKAKFDNVLKSSENKDELVVLLAAISNYSSDLNKENRILDTNYKKYKAEKDHVDALRTQEKSALEVLTNIKNDIGRLSSDHSLAKEKHRKIHNHIKKLDAKLVEANKNLQNATFASFRNQCIEKIKQQLSKTP